VWVNNCLGRGNYRWFLALLFTTGIVLAYGAYLAHIVVSPRVERNYYRYEHWYRYKGSSDPPDWGAYFGMKLHYFLIYTGIYLEQGGLRTAGVGLLALLTWPLPFGLLAYHVYLIWAGMTTNESSKWADWRDDMADGAVFLGRRREETLKDERSAPGAQMPSATPNSIVEEEEPPTSWPLQSRHILIRTMDGQPPQSLPSRIRSVADEDSFERVWNLSAVENVYDLGFWDNFLEAMK
jgi:palmitoyltransferase